MNLKGKKAFIAGIGDDQGYGWAIAKSLAEAGCEILVGTWTPILKIFTTSYEMGKFDASRKLSNGEMMKIKKIYALDASFDKPEDVPQEIAENKRYQAASGYTISEVAKQVEKDFGKIDILVHSLANGPEVKKPLLETSRSGYLAALSSSSYSLVSMIAYFGHVMRGNRPSQHLCCERNAFTAYDWRIAIRTVSLGKSPIHVQVRLQKQENQPPLPLHASHCPHTESPL